MINLAIFEILLMPLVLGGLFAQRLDGIPNLDAIHAVITRTVTTAVFQMTLGRAKGRENDLSLIFGHVTT
jgi:hypothetical protein